MSLLVQKYGGTSLATPEQIIKVAARIIKEYEAGHSLVVVVSAMGDETERLSALSREVTTRNPNLRELDTLLATGEQASMSLLAMALNDKGYKACSFSGWQVKIMTDEYYGHARITDIDTQRIKAKLSDDEIVIVAGFQGITPSNDVTTLGRGGSDITAVALAVALDAKECQIYTDVAGVYTADPRIVPEARLLPEITFEEMLELSSLGTKVLHKRAVEYAGKFKVVLRVLSTFLNDPGTLIIYKGKEMQTSVVSGVTYSKSEARVLVRGIPDTPGVAARILQPISDAHIEIDMILQNIGEGDSTDFTFTVQREDLAKVVTIMKRVAEQLGASKVITDDRVAKLSLVGTGMRTNFGVASRMFAAMGSEGINIQLITSSEIKVSILIDEKYLELGIRALHETFKLGK